MPKAIFYVLKGDCNLQALNQQTQRSYTSPEASCSILNKKETRRLSWLVRFPARAPIPPILENSPSCSFEKCGPSFSRFLQEIYEYTILRKCGAEANKGITKRKRLRGQVRDS